MNQTPEAERTLTEADIQVIGANLPPFQDAAFRAQQGQQMTKPEQQQYDMLMIFARQVEALTWQAARAIPQAADMSISDAKIDASGERVDAVDVPRAAAEPVLWVESEPSARLLDLSEVIQGMCHSVMYHTREPRTSNPVWPLYTHAAPDRAPSIDSATERDAARFRWLLQQIPCSIADDLGCGLGEIGDEIDGWIAEQERGRAIAAMKGEA